MGISKHIKNLHTHELYIKEEKMKEKKQKNTSSVVGNKCDKNKMDVSRVVLRSEWIHPGGHKPSRQTQQPSPGRWDERISFLVHQVLSRVPRSG